MGLGHSLTVMLALQAVLLLHLATVAGREAAAVRLMIAAIGLATAVEGAIAWPFIFPDPAALSTVRIGCLGTAYFTARRSKDPSDAP